MDCCSAGAGACSQSRQTRTATRIGRPGRPIRRQVLDPCSTCNARPHRGGVPRRIHRAAAKHGVALLGIGPISRGHVMMAGAYCQQSAGTTTSSRQLVACLLEPHLAASLCLRRSLLDQRVTSKRRGPGLHRTPAAGPRWPPQPERPRLNRTEPSGPSHRAPPVDCPSPADRAEPDGRQTARRRPGRAQPSARPPGDRLGQSAGPLAGVRPKGPAVPLVGKSASPRRTKRESSMQV